MAAPKRNVKQCLATTEGPTSDVVSGTSAPQIPPYTDRTARVGYHGPDR